MQGMPETIFREVRNHHGRQPDWSGQMVLRHVANRLLQERHFFIRDRQGSCGHSEDRVVSSPSNPLADAERVARSYVEPVSFNPALRLRGRIGA